MKHKLQRQNYFVAATSLCPTQKVGIIALLLFALVSSQTSTWIPWGGEDAYNGMKLEAEFTSPVDGRDLTSWYPFMTSTLIDKS